MNGLKYTHKYIFLSMELTQILLKDLSILVHDLHNSNTMSIFFLC